jgi:hypothetical protein
LKTKKNSVSVEHNKLQKDLQEYGAGFLEVAKGAKGAQIGHW